MRGNSEHSDDHKINDIKNIFVFLIKMNVSAWPKWKPVVRTVTMRHRRGSEQKRHMICVNVRNSRHSSKTESGGKWWEHELQRGFRVLNKEDSALETAKGDGGKRAFTLFPSRPWDTEERSLRGLPGPPSRLKEREHSEKKMELQGIGFTAVEANHSNKSFTEHVLCDHQYSKLSSWKNFGSPLNNPKL